MPFLHPRSRQGRSLPSYTTTTMTDVSSPLNAPTRFLEPRILSTSSSFSSISSTSSVRHNQALNGFSSPCSVASPILNRGTLGDDEEIDDLGSDVERSFG